MKRVKRILFLVGGILSIVMAASFFIVGLVFVVLGPTIGAYMAETDQQAADIFLGVYLSIGLVFVIVSVFGIINAILSFKAMNSNSKSLMVANIVFGILSDVIVNVVGGIIGFILIDREKEDKDNAIEG
ncbi:MAG: hypothetical protein IJ247_00905 [Bacilli bacterium]|nr:hypothetical protein [Bacilli bacterium]